MILPLNRVTSVSYTHLDVYKRQEEKRRNWELEQKGLFRQMSLFDDFHMEAAPPAEERVSVLTGEM